MRTSSRLFLIAALLLVHRADAQFNTLLSTHGRTNATITQGITIGNIGAVPSPTQAFQVRGDLLGAGSTGEVFRTNAPAANNTFWRLFSGGTGTANERGNLFAETGFTRFNVNAPNGQLRLMTNTLPRVRVNETGNYLGLGNFTGINADGYVLISPNNNFSANAFGPYSRLHLAEGVLGQNTQQTGYRPWMRNGITFTGNNDQMYIGALYRGLDYSDCVVNWSDNPGSQIGDRMRFLFTSGNTQTTDTTGADGLYGLEAMRMKPVEGGSEIFVGVGDYQRTGTDPKERLEVLDRTIRIDSLIPDYRNDTLTRVVMVDSTGRLHWRHINTWPDSVGTGSGGGSNCIWAQNGLGNPITATSFGGLCPTQSKLVGVGIASPTAKLDVYHSTANTGTDNFALQATLLGVGTTNSNHGVSGSVGGTGLNLYGVRGQAQGTTANSHVYGVAGSAYLPNASTPGAEAVGVYGLGNGGADATASSVGVMGRALAGNPSQRWGGFFFGTAGASGSFLSGQTYTMSDAALKTNVQDVVEPWTLLAQLQPKSYAFVNANEALDLAPGTHYGFMAQDVQNVLPDLVKTFSIPAMRDADGTTAEPSQEVMAVNYTEMIPLLVAGMNDLKATVDQQNAQIDLLQAQLAQCCAGGPVDNRSLDANGVNAGSFETDLRIVPNPVAANTQLRCTVGTPGRIRLEVTDNSGRVIEVLEEATRSTGSFTYEWNTQQLAAGTYYCTLYVNDEPLVKKAVKLNER